MTHSARASIVLLIAAVGLAGCKNNPQGYREAGDRDYLYGHYDTAADAYGKYLEIRPGEPDVRAQYGRALLRAGKPKEAAQQLSISNLEAPDDDVLDDLCAALAASGQFDELHRTLRAYANDRGSARDYLRYGKYAVQMGDPDAAKTSLLTAAKLDGGKSPAPYVALYDYCMAVNQPSPDKAQAIRYLRMAYFIAPKNPDVQSRVAQSGQVVGPTFGLPPSVAGDQ